MNIIIINSSDIFLGSAEVGKDKVEVTGISIYGPEPTKDDIQSFVEAENLGELKTVTYQGAVNHSIQPITKVMDRHLSVARTVMKEVKKSHLAEHQNYKFRKAMKGE